MKTLLLSAFAFIMLSTQAQVLIAGDSVPVRVSYFGVEQNISKTTLHWKVVCNLNYANFEVESSLNGSDYTSIHTFTADRLRCQSPFDFEDKISSERIFYRLKIGDKDGKFSTSKTLVAFGRQKSFEINSVTPSLVTGSTLLSISSAENDKAEILITNMQGYTVRRIQSSLGKGVTDIALDLSNLPKGLYTLKVINSALDFHTKRIARL